jgi:bacterial/archaeal transporter family-2 protein
VGTAIALILIGQVIGSLAIDHYGLLRSLVFPLTGARVVGAVLMAAGAFIAMRR